MKTQSRMIPIASVILIFYLMAMDVFASDLLNALSTRNLNKIKELASAGADLNERDPGLGRTPVMWAAIQGQREIVVFLISMGVDLNVKDKEGKTALMLASWAGNKEIAAILLDGGADVNLADKDGNTSLMIALCEIGGRDVAQLLISKGADINTKNNFGNTPLMIAFQNFPEIAELLISKGADIYVKNRGGTTTLDYAAALGKQKIVELIVSKGIDIASKNKALMAAASSGQKDTAGFLISNGASVAYNKGHHGKTPLMEASERGHYGIAELLISAGADVNAKDYDGITPLIFTLKYGKREYASGSDGKVPPAYYTELTGRKKVAELLIEKGADVNVTDYKGQTPLMYTAINDIKELAELLISKGAFTNLKDDLGNTALSYARKNKNTEIAKLITSNPRPAQLAKKRTRTVTVDKEAQVAKETLERFFNKLHDEKYNDAVCLFEPIEEDWREWSELSEDKKADELRFTYRSVGIPIKPKVLEVWNVDSGVYRFEVQFITDSGTIYVQGPCCGATEEMTPSQSEFIFFVRKTTAGYKVGTFPVYRP